MSMARWTQSQRATVVVVVMDKHLTIKSNCRILRKINQKSIVLFPTWSEPWSKKEEMMVASITSRDSCSSALEHQEYPHTGAVSSVHYLSCYYAKHNQTYFVLLKYIWVYEENSFTCWEKMVDFCCTFHFNRLPFVLLPCATVLCGHRHCHSWRHITR